MSADKLARSARILRAAFATARAARPPPRAVTLRSTPRVDDDLCLLATAPHVLTTGGGFGGLVDELRERIRHVASNAST